MIARSLSSLDPLGCADELRPQEVSSSLLFFLEQRQMPGFWLYVRDARIEVICCRLGSESGSQKIATRRTQVGAGKEERSPRLSTSTLRRRSLVGSAPSVLHPYFFCLCTARHSEYTILLCESRWDIVRQPLSATHSASCGRDLVRCRGSPRRAANPVPLNRWTE